MDTNIILSIDAMGGANAPQSVIEGLEIVCKQHDNISFLLFGKQSEIEPLLSNTQKLKNCSTIYDCATVICDNEQPVKAMKSGVESSMRAAIDATTLHGAHACISSGSTGALMVMAKIRLGMLSGIKRPAIVSVFPNRAKGTVMLDLGANAECDVTHLSQFAIMGLCFAKIVLGLDNSPPSLGILNMGTESYKGRSVDRELAQLLSQTNLDFRGFVEGHDLSEGTIDVVVTDGFTGNIALKVAEGVAKTCLHYMKHGFKSSFFSRIGALLASRGLKKSFSIIDPRHYNGAMLIGLNKIVVKSHGSSDATSFANAVNVAINLVKQNINDKIIDMMEQQKDFLTSHRRGSPDAPSPKTTPNPR